MHDGRTQIYKYSPFSFVVDGVNAGLEQFCKSDDCFDLYMLFRKINNGFSCTAFKNVQTLALWDINKAKDCFGDRVYASSGSSSGSSSTSPTPTATQPVKTPAVSTLTPSPSKSESKSGSDSGKEPVSLSPAPTNSTASKSDDTTTISSPAPTPGDKSSSGDGNNSNSTTSASNSVSVQPPQSAKMDITVNSGQNSSTLISIIGGSVGAVAVIAICLFVLYKRKLRQKQNEGVDIAMSSDPTTGFTSMTSNEPRAKTGGSSGSRTTNPIGTTHSSNKSGNSSGSAFWDDEAVDAVRIPYEKIEFGKLISRGGYGEVYQGKYRDEIENFLAEVKMAAAMDHEHIVRFIVLAKFQRSGSHELGFDPDKVKNALHVAHALTYMHSFQPVVLHRDLKSRNILLDNELNAKLTDFGVSRERADKVMMGKRYDEKADVFSFGVVLSELDLHELPYAHAVESGTGRKLPDTVIVHMVSIGRLQVEFVNPTKSEMAKVGLDCIALDPTARPTAAEVLNRVHQIWLRHQQL